MQPSRVPVSHFPPEKGLSVAAHQQEVISEIKVLYLSGNALDDPPILKVG